MNHLVIDFPIPEVWVVDRCFGAHMPFAKNRFTAQPVRAYLYTHTLRWWLIELFAESIYKLCNVVHYLFIRSWNRPIPRHVVNDVNARVYFRVVYLGQSINIAFGSGDKSHSDRIGIRISVELAQNDHIFMRNYANEV